MADLTRQIDTTTCPICGAPRVKKLISGPPWEICYCKACTVAWTVPPPDHVDYTTGDFHACIESHEAGETIKTLADLPVQWQQSVVMQADLLVNSLPRGSSILEIGCGEGLLLRELKKRGFLVTGIEPSQSASERARSSGLNVVTGSFPKDIPPRHFDAVVMSHVLEHLPDPLSILQEVEKIALGGHMLFVQTNWRGIVPRIYCRRWYAWAPSQHYWHFTPKALGILIGQLHWQVEKLEYSSLIHRENAVTYVASRVESWLDQFHLLAKIPS